MIKCKHCGSAKVQSYVLEEFAAANLLGAPFDVFLGNAVKEYVCGKCGKVLGHTIPEPDELVAVVAILRAFDPIKLNGTEIKFLRKSLDWKAKDLAEQLNVRPEHLSKWENEKMPISESCERLLRALVCIFHSDSAPAVDVDLSSFTKMKVVCARDANKRPVFRISRIPASEIVNPVKWKREAA